MARLDRVDASDEHRSFTGHELKGHFLVGEQIASVGECQVEIANYFVVVVRERNELLLKPGAFLVLARYYNHGVLVKIYTFVQHGALQDEFDRVPVIDVIARAPFFCGLLTG